MNLANIRRLFADEDAVSPVIGIILVVAITVILAAIVGVYALGLGSDVQNAPPNADFDFNYANTNASTSGVDQVTIEHNGGQPIERDNIDVVVGGNTKTADTQFPTRFSSGDTAVYPLNSTDAGKTLRIVWRAPNGDSSNTIGESRVPE